MLRSLVPLLLAAGAGGAIVLQQALNSNVRTALNSAAWAGFASYMVGLVSMVVFIIVMRDPVPTAAAAARIPWWGWSGGFLGAIYIGLAIVLIPEIGAATFVALLVAGQMIASMAFDHYGLLGLDTRPIDLTRLAGAALLIAGVVLIRR